MVKVEIKRNERGEIISYSAWGHADFAPQGEDIVCAAVSVLIQTIALGLLDNLGLKVETEIKDGYFHCLLPPSLEGERREKAFLLVEVMLTGLREIARLHPGNLKIID